MEYYLSCSSLSMQPFHQSMEAIADNFDGWEIVAEGRHNMQLISKEFEDVSSSYDLKYSVHLPFSDVNISSLNRTIRAASINEVASGIRMGAELGMKRFVLHPGQHSLLSLQDTDRALMLSREGLRTLQELASSVGAELLVENMPSGHSIGSKARELFRLVNGTGAGICLDISHASLQNELDSFISMKQMIGSVHISDNDGVSDSHMPVGEGKVGYVDLIEKIEELNLPVVIEARSIEEAIRGKEYIESIKNSMQ